MYHVDCDCGKSVRVELAQAGMTLICPLCRAEIPVPSVSQLKRLSGDQDPFLGTLEKIERAVHEKTSPFHGACHECERNPATVHLPVAFRFLVKRHIKGQEGFHLGATGINLSVGAASEQWRTVRFPLLFCQDCHDEFKRKQSYSSLYSAGKYGLLITVLLPILVVGLLLAMLMPCVSIPAAILVITMVTRYHTRKRVDPMVLYVLDKIPLIGEAIAVEDEYQIDVALPHPYVTPKTT